MGHLITVYFFAELKQLGERTGFYPYYLPSVNYSFNKNKEFLLLMKMRKLPIIGYDLSFHCMCFWKNSFPVKTFQIMN